MRTQLPTLHPGEPLPAWWLNQLASAVNRLLRLRVSGPLRLIWSAGVPTISVGSSSTTSDEISARIVARGSGAFYSWHEVYPTSGGNWSDGPQSGTTTDNSTLEQNNNTAVGAGIRVRMFRVNGQWTFQLGPCNPVAKTPIIPPEPQQSQATLPPPESAAVIGGMVSTSSGGGAHLAHIQSL